VDAREGSVTTVARKRATVGLVARRESDSGSGKAGREDARGDGNGTRRGAVEGRSAIWCVPGTAGGRGRLVRRLVQTGRAGDAGRDAGARRSARPPVGPVTRRRRETKNLLKERNKVRPRPQSTARTSGDSTRTPSRSTGSRSTSSSSSSSSSTLGRTSVGRTTSANTPCSSNSSSSSSSRPSRTGSTSTARSSSRTPSRANSSKLSRTTRSSSSSTARTSTPRTSRSRSTSSSSSTTPAPGKPVA
ncbi:unnamed protein product, partial [Closterium sp. NIES-54]